MNNQRMSNSPTVSAATQTPSTPREVEWRRLHLSHDPVLLDVSIKLAQAHQAAEEQVQCQRLSLFEIPWRLDSDRRSDRAGC